MLSAISPHHCDNAATSDSKQLRCKFAGRASPGYQTGSPHLCGSGPGQNRAFDNAVSHVGCPDRRIDRLCITCCPSSQPSHHAGCPVRSRYAASATGSPLTLDHHRPGHPCERFAPPPCCARGGDASVAPRRWAGRARVEHRHQVAHFFHGAASQARSHRGRQLCAPCEREPIDGPLPSLSAWRLPASCSKYERPRRRCLSSRDD